MSLVNASKAPANNSHHGNDSTQDLSAIAEELGPASFLLGHGASKEMVETQRSSHRNSLDRKSLDRKSMERRSMDGGARQSLDLEAGEREAESKEEKQAKKMLEKEEKTKKKALEKVRLIL